MKLSLVICLAKYFETDKTIGGYRLKDLIIPVALVPSQQGLSCFSPIWGLLSFYSQRLGP
jgi:hypothetical protein